VLSVVERMIRAAMQALLEVLSGVARRAQVDMLVASCQAERRRRASKGRRGLRVLGRTDGFDDFGT